MSFGFQLEGLLRIRRVEEERRTRLLVECQERVRKHCEQLERTRSERAEHLEQLAALGDGQLDMTLILAHRRCLNALARRQANLTRELRPLQEQVLVAQRELEVAVNSRKVVERLRERRYDAYRAERRRIEGRELDEMSQARFATRAERGR